MVSGPQDPSSGGLPAARSNAETLAYMSDIIFEVRQLAEKGGFLTLAAILNAALVEARLQTEEWD